MRNIGYVRVSSADQNPARQVKQLQQIKMDILYQEKVSGAERKRPKLQKLLRELQKGDIIWVTDLTRITRSTAELFQLVAYIQKKGDNLQSIKDTWLDVTVEKPYNKFLLTTRDERRPIVRSISACSKHDNGRYTGISRLPRFMKKQVCPNLRCVICWDEHLIEGGMYKERSVLEITRDLCHRERSVYILNHPIMQ